MTWTIRQDSYDANGELIGASATLKTDKEEDARRALKSWMPGRLVDTALHNPGSYTGTWTMPDGSTARDVVVVEIK